MRAVDTCDVKGAIRYKVFTRRVRGSQPLSGWSYQGTRCEGSDETDPGIQQPEVTTQDVVDRAREAAPVPAVGVEPRARSYVNVPNNFYTTMTDPVTKTVTVLGVPVEVTFTPTEHSWDFGDGFTGSGAGIKGAEIGQEGAVEHVYKRRGTYEVTVTTTYSLSFSLPGGGEVSIPGEVSQTSEPVAYEVEEIQTVVTDVD